MPSACFVVLALAACHDRLRIPAPLEPDVAERGPGRRGASAAGSMLGVWTAGASGSRRPSPPGLPTTGTGCSKFEWFVTSQSANAISGDFTATCLGSITLSGTARGERNGAAVQVTVNGAAVAAGDWGTARSRCRPPGRLRATTRFGCRTRVRPASARSPGVETLRRNPVPAAPAPPPALALSRRHLRLRLHQRRQSSRAQATAVSARYLANDKEALVRCVHDLVRPARTVEGAFEVTKRVAWALRHQGGGLLIKNGGENIVPWQGYWFSAGRVCYPGRAHLQSADGHSDAPMDRRGRTTASSTGASTCRRLIRIGKE